MRGKKEEEDEKGGGRCANQMGPGQYLCNQHQSKVSHLFRLLAFSDLMCVTHE